MPNKLFQFWLELKRRRVHRLMAIYAGSAYVIFEASTLIFPRWGLPDWTIDLVLYLLILGAIVTFVMGWIYDLTPDGIQKTGPVNEISTKETSPTPNGWKIASYISLVVIVLLIVLNIIPSTGKNEILDKSIAVLPFESLSKDPEMQYQADGVMDAILLHLSKIEDLRVMSRTSVEQYRDSKKTIPEICMEMNVSYVLEGSFQKSGDQIRLIVQLIRAGMEGHVWANNYDREWKDIFAVQSEVAQTVAGEVQAVITPLEKQRIDKIPTADLTAYDFFMRGIDEWRNNNDQRAEELFKEALRYDSTYAEAYVYLGDIYITRSLNQDYFSNRFQDSAMILANIALSYEKELSLAHVLKGQIFYLTGELDQAILEFEKAVEINPNDGISYRQIGGFYFYSDFVKSIESFHKALDLCDINSRPIELKNLGWAYLFAGLKDKFYDYLGQALELDGDSVDYYSTLANFEFLLGNYTKTIEYCQAALEIDSSIMALFYLGRSYSLTGRVDESLKYMKSALKKVPEDQLLQGFFINRFHRVAYTFWINDLEEEAVNYFDQFVEFQLELIKMERPLAQTSLTYYDLAGVYAFRGETDKALESLRLFNQMKIFPYWMAEFIKWDELFDPIRDEPEFQQIVREVEAKYQAEHERVRKWLEENDML